MKVLCKCGMRVDDHPNAMCEHLKSPAYGDRLMSHKAPSWLLFWLGSMLHQHPGSILKQQQQLHKHQAAALPGTRHPLLRHPLLRQSVFLVMMLMCRLRVLLLLRLMLCFLKAAVLLPLPLPMQLGHSLKAVPPMLLKAMPLMLLMLPNGAPKQLLLRMCATPFCF